MNSSGTGPISCSIPPCCSARPSGAPLYHVSITESLHAARELVKPRPARVHPGGCLHARVPHERLCGPQTGVLRDVIAEGMAQQVGVYVRGYPCPSSSVSHACGIHSSPLLRHRTTPSVYFTGWPPAAPRSTYPRLRSSRPACAFYGVASRAEPPAHTAPPRSGRAVRARHRRAARRAGHCSCCSSVPPCWRLREGLSARGQRW
jgi:hypothetical protein